MLRKKNTDDVKSIISHSNCGCYDLHIENEHNELVFQ
jgi:hypothetical protein